MCPNECPGLPDTHSEAFEQLYEKYEQEGKFRKQIQARALWQVCTHPHCIRIVLAFSNSWVPLLGHPGVSSGDGHTLRHVQGRLQPQI
jgi:hypothetical protein